MPDVLDQDAALSNDASVDPFVGVAIGAAVGAVCSCLVIFMLSAYLLKRWRQRKRDRKPSKSAQTYVRSISRNLDAAPRIRVGIGPVAGEDRKASKMKEEPHTFRHDGLASSQTPQTPRSDAADPVPDLAHQISLTKVQSSSII